MSEETARATKPPSPTRTVRFRAGAIVALAVVGGLILWLALRDTGGSSTPAAANEPKAVSEDDIRTLAESVGHPVFWVGPKDGYTYELTRTANGSIYVRYLPEGEDVGTDKTYLTVGTYPFAGAYDAIKKIAKKKGITRLELDDGGLAEVAKASPTSVHAAYPGVDYQVEVYDPTAGTATGLVATGQLRAIGDLKAQAPTSAEPSAEAATPAELKSLARTLGHPIYWIGPKRGYTYEVTRNADNHVFVRYLPQGVDVGSRDPYTTVATYPFAGAFDAVMTLSRQKNGGTISLDNGGRAVIDADNPKSIHLAYPGSDLEIEVFDPSAARAKQIVTSGRLASIG